MTNKNTVSIQCSKCGSCEPDVQECNLCDDWGRVKIRPVTFSNGVSVVNATPHPITFQDGEKLVTVPRQLLINASVVEEKVSNLLVTTKFFGNEEGREIIKSIKNSFPDVLIIGSIIAAQAYQGDVLAMTPAKGFERVPPEEKRMNTDKFTVF